jgi:hypothetical protein
VGHIRAEGYATALARLIAASILWNSRYLAAALDNLRHDGQWLSTEIMKHVTPLGWEHISLTGDYIWNDRSRPAQRSTPPTSAPAVTPCGLIGPLSVPVYRT